ncbi:sensor histidine kinase [Clostridium polynesiense]|uniref:sensor histidine kinase n=1 Tax=Clostridium polynesiense TaxID=1325933 RepID=UPI00058E028F|nr:ATP-binding protein [Clostridium polynesiense]
MKNKIVVKITLGIICIIFLSTLILGFVSYGIFKDYTYNNKKSSLASKAQELAYLLKAESIEQGNSSVYEKLSDYTESVMNGRIWITDKTGSLVFFSRRGGRNHGITGNIMNNSLDQEILKEALKGSRVIKKSSNNYYGENMLLVAEPILSDSNEVKGTVLLFSPIRDLKEAQIKFLKYLLIALIIELFLTGILSFYYSKFITKPLLSMAVFAEELSRGNYKIKNSITQKDEIGMLAASLNELSQRLDDNITTLMEEEAVRKEFVANVSHEFRTPLTILKGRLESLMDGVVQKDKIQYYYESMLKEVNRLTRMVNDLLDLSRLENNKLILNIEDVDVELLLEEVLDNITVLAKEAHVKINADYDISSLHIVGDYDRLKQLLIIFLDNAIKYSPPNTYVTLKASVDDSLHLIIEDQGQGIPERELKNIWKRFYKIDKSRMDTLGTGLGLAIAKYIIELHNGKADISSNLNEGTIITLSLPIPK